MNTESLTYAEMKKHLGYNPETGNFWWIKARKGTRAGTTAGGIVKGYRRICINLEKHYAHRLAWLYVHGEWPNGEIDHINQIKDDNRIDNLRVVSHQQNNQNKPLNSNNTSGVHGVAWCNRDKKWRVSIKANYKHIALGNYDTKTKAIAKRKMAEVIYGFHLNHGGAG